MFTVLPISRRGDRFGGEHLTNLMVHHRSKVRAIIEIGGCYMDDFGELVPYTRTTFIVLMIDTVFNFTAFVADRIKVPEPENTGAYRFYNKFEKFISEFMKDDDNKGIYERDFFVARLDFNWETFYEEISRDFGYTDENVSELRNLFNNESLGAWTINKTMEAYRSFLVNCVFTKLYESVITPESRYADAEF
jgi:hypothetical protein